VESSEPRRSFTALHFVQDDNFQNFAEWCAKYDRSGNPLFIPEAQNSQSLANAFFAVAEYNAMGYSSFSRSEGEPPRFSGLIIMLSKDEFLVAGSGLIVTFAPRSGNAVAGIASLDEGVFADGKWVPGRRLNGDQSHQGRHLHLPGNIFGIQKARLYLYK